MICSRYASQTLAGGSSCPSLCFLKIFAPQRIFHPFVDRLGWPQLSLKVKSLLSGFVQNNFPRLCTFYNLQSIVHTRPLFWHQMSIWNLDVRQPTFMFYFIFGNQFSWFFIGRIWCIGHINLGLYYVAVSIAFSFHNYKAASKIYSLWKDLKTIDTARCTSMCRARWQMPGNGRIYLKKINKLMISHSKNQYWGFYI